MSYLESLTKAGTQPICQHHLYLLASGGKLDKSSTVLRKSNRSFNHLRKPQSETIKPDNQPRFSSKQSGAGDTGEDDTAASMPMDGGNTEETVSVNHTVKTTESARDFLLSVAGMFGSGLRDGSDSVKLVVAEAVEAKYRGDGDDNSG